MEIDFIITPTGISQQPEEIAQALAVIAQAEPTSQPDSIKTIFEQVGTDALLAVSAREVTRLERGVAFRFGNRYGLRRVITITYRPASDDYSILATRTHRNGCTRVIAEYEGITGESLGWLVRDINQEEAFA